MQPPFQNISPAVATAERPNSATIHVAARQDESDHGEGPADATRLLVRADVAWNRPWPFATDQTCGYARAKIGPLTYHAITPPRQFREAPQGPENLLAQPHHNV